MNNNMGRIGGMLAVGILLSAGRAWARPDTDPMLTAEERRALSQPPQRTKDDVKIDKLSELFVRDGVNVACPAEQVAVAGADAAIYCVESHKDAQGRYDSLVKTTTILSYEQLKSSKFEIVRIWGKIGFMPNHYLGFSPFVSEARQRHESFQDAGALVSREEISSALDGAWLKRLKLKRNALREMKIRLDAAGSPFDSTNR